MYYISCFYLAVFLISSWQLFHPLLNGHFLFSFLSNAIVYLLTNTLGKWELICRICQFFMQLLICLKVFCFMLTPSSMFFLLLFFSLICKSSLRSINSVFSICLFKLSSLYSNCLHLNVKEPCLWCKGIYVFLQIMP